MAVARDHARAMTGPAGPKPMRTVRVRSLSRVLRVALVGEIVVLELPGQWRVHLTRPEAWALTEALDELATKR